MPAAAEPRPGPEQRWISIAECARLIGVHEQTCYSWVAFGQLPAARIGRKVLIDRVRLERDLEQQMAGQQGAKAAAG